MRPPSYFLPFQIHIPQLSVQTATEQKILMANMLYVEQVFLGIPVCMQMYYVGALMNESTLRRAYSNFYGTKETKGGLSMV